MLSRKLMLAGKTGPRYLYNRGSLFSDITGGWNASVARVPSSYTVKNNVYRYQTYNFAESGGWSVYELSYPYCPAACTVNAIDLSGFSRLCMEYTMSNVSSLNGYQYLCLGVFSSRSIYLPYTTMTSSNPTIKRETVNTNNGGIRTLAVDISTVFQTGYVAVYFACNTITQTSPQPDLKIYSVWLE